MANYIQILLICFTLAVLSYQNEEDNSQTKREDTNPKELSETEKEKKHQQLLAAIENRAKYGRIREKSGCVNIDCMKKYVENIKERKFKRVKVGPDSSPVAGRGMRKSQDDEDLDVDFDSIAKEMEERHDSGRRHKRLSQVQNIDSNCATVSCKAPEGYCVKLEPVEYLGIHIPNHPLLGCCPIYKCYFHGNLGQLPSPYQVQSNGQNQSPTPQTQGTLQSNVQPNQGIILSNGQKIQREMQSKGQPNQGAMQPHEQPNQGEMQSKGHPNQGEKQSHGQPNQGEMQSHWQPNQGGIQSHGHPNQGETQSHGQPNQGEMQSHWQPNQGAMQPHEQPNQGEMQSKGHPNQGETQSHGQPNHGEMQSKGYPNPGKMQSKGYPNPEEMQSHGPPNQGEMQTKGQLKQGEMQSNGQPNQETIQSNGKPHQGRVTSKGQPYQEAMQPNGQPNQGEMQSNGQPNQGEVHSNGQPPNQGTKLSTQFNPPLSKDSGKEFFQDMFNQAFNNDFNNMDKNIENNAKKPNDLKIQDSPTSSNMLEPNQKVQSENKKVDKDDNKANFPTNDGINKGATKEENTPHGVSITSHVSDDGTKIVEGVGTGKSDVTVNASDDDDFDEKEMEDMLREMEEIKNAGLEEIALAKMSAFKPLGLGPITNVVGGLLGINSLQGPIQYKSSQSGNGLLGGLTNAFGTPGYQMHNTAEPNKGGDLLGSLSNVLVSGRRSEKTLENTTEKLPKKTKASSSSTPLPDFIPPKKGGGLLGLLG